MAAALRTPWLGSSAEKELRFALDELHAYLPGTHFERGKLICSPDEIQLSSTKKHHVQIIGDFSVDEDDSIGVQISDGTGFIPASFNRDCIDNFEKQNRRNFKTIRGAIVTINSYQLILRPFAERDQELFIRVSNFKLLGSDGSKTFGDPSNIVMEGKVQNLIQKLTRLLSEPAGELVIFTPTQRQRNVNSDLHSQTAFHTQVPHSHFTANHKKPGLSVQGLESRRITRSDNDTAQGRLQECSFPHQKKREKTSNSISALSPVPLDEIQRSTSKLESKFNERQSQSTNNSQSVKSVERYLSSETRCNREIEVILSSSPVASNSEAEHESAEDESEHEIYGHADELGDTAIVKINVRSPVETQLPFFDIFQAQDPFVGMKRVPRKFVRIPKEQQTLLEGNTWFRANSPAQADTAILPSRVVDDLANFSSRNIMVENDEEVPSESSCSSDEENPASNKKGGSLEAQTRNLSQESDADDEDGYSDDKLNRFALQQDIDSEGHGSYVEEKGLRSEVHFDLAASDSSNGSVDDGEAKQLEPKTSAFIEVPGLFDEENWASPTGSHEEEVDQEVDSLLEVNDTSSRIELELAVPLEINDCFEEDDDDEPEIILPGYEIPSTAINQNPQFVQVDRTPNVQYHAFAKPLASIQHRKRPSHDLSSDPIIPATHGESGSNPHALVGEGNPAPSSAHPINMAIDAPNQVPGIIKCPMDIGGLPDKIALLAEPSSGKSNPPASVVSAHDPPTSVGSTPLDDVRRESRQVSRHSRSRRRSTNVKEVNKRIAAQIATEQDRPSCDTYQMTRDTRAKFKDQQASLKMRLVRQPPRSHESSPESSLPDVDTASSGASLNLPSLPSAPTRDVAGLTAFSVGQEDLAQSTYATAPETEISKETQAKLTSLPPESTQSNTTEEQEHALFQSQFFVQEASSVKNAGEAVGSGDSIGQTQSTHNAVLVDEDRLGPEMETFQEFQTSVTHIDTIHVFCQETQAIATEQNALETVSVSVGNHKDDPVPLKDTPMGPHSPLGQRNHQRLFPLDVGSPQTPDLRQDSNSPAALQYGDRNPIYGARNDGAVESVTQPGENLGLSSKHSFFERFRLTYPAYTGSQSDFTLAMVYIEYLIENGIFGHSHMCDDFIRFYPEDYLALRGDKLKISGWELFKKKVKRPVFEEDIISSENTGEVLTTLDAEDVARMRARFARSSLGLLFDSRRSSISRGTSMSREDEFRPAVPLQQPDLRQDKNPPATDKKHHAIQPVAKPISRQPFFETASQVLSVSKRKERDIISPPPVKRRKTLPWPNRTPEKPQTPQTRRILKSSASRPVATSAASPILGDPDRAPRSDRGLATRNVDPFHGLTIREEKDRRRTFDSANLTTDAQTISGGRRGLGNQMIRLDSDPDLFRAFLQNRMRNGYLNVSRSVTPTSSPGAGGRRYSLLPKQTP